MTRADADSELQQAFSHNIAVALRELLETKHLYQSVQVQEVAERKAIAEQAPHEVRGLVLVRHEELIHGPWIPTYPRQLLRNAATGITGPQGFHFRPPDLKLFCGRCDRREASNLLTVRDSFELGEYRFDSHVSSRYQLFTLNYQCQSCKGVPEVFLVERKDLKLILSGRAPMEVMEVPPAIPKEVRRFYRGALLAQHVGQTLAANFLLRTVIEQWARAAVSKQGKLRGEMKADDIIDAYMDSLPPEFKTTFESMRALYGALSADIHSAAGSPELFGRASQQIDRHFDARRLFEL